MVKTTQKSLKSEVNRILNKYKDNEFFDKKDESVVANIYMPYLQHKKNSKIIIKKIQRRIDIQPGRKNYPQIWFHVENLQPFTCNKTKAIRFKCNGKTISLEQIVKQQMRKRISNQTLDLKMELCQADNTLTCRLCENNYDFRLIDCDHDKISFNTLVEDFCKQNNFTFTKKMTDVLLNEWADYHKLHAKLRILCKECHKKHGLKN